MPEESTPEILAAVQERMPLEEAGGFIAERERSDVVAQLLATESIESETF